MKRAERAPLRFVRAVLAGAEVNSDDAGAVAAGVRLDAAAFAQLVSSGVVNAEGRPRPEARSWLRRQLLDAEAFAAQHRVEMQQADGTRINLAESPLVRLATGATPFLAPHQVEAGERVRQLCDRARLQPRLTMSYSAAHVVGGTRAAAGELSDMAADLRKQLAALHRALPEDCAGVVLDVCGLLKGLQQVESERNWPRRSAKLVLRIGLEQAARHFGLSAEARGVEGVGPSAGASGRRWSARPRRALRCACG